MHICPASKRKKNVAVLSESFQKGREFQITWFSSEGRERGKIGAVVSPVGAKPWRIAGCFERAYGSNELVIPLPGAHGSSCDSFFPGEKDLPFCLT